MNRLQARMLTTGMMVAALLSPAAAFADIYKWVDANGQVHFGDAAPKDGRIAVTTLVKDDKDEPIKAHETPSPLVQERQRSIAEQLREERLKREEAANREAQRKQKQEASCEYAKNRIAHMKSVHVFYNVNPDGTTRYLSDKEGDRVRKQADELYKQHCTEQASFVTTR